jgi:tetratricopeptide (TPR) repeat protein
MAGTYCDQLFDLPAAVRTLLAAPPLTEKKLLEVGVGWARVTPRIGQIADALRLFVIMGDPLEPLAPRPDAIATVNADSSGLEFVIYVPCWSLTRLAVEKDATVAEVLGTLAGSAVLTAAAQERAVLSGRYPDLVTQGAAPDLLADLAAGATLGPAAIRLVSRDWEDIGLGAITDVAQHAFGVVELDRSPVELPAARSPRPNCPACAGRRFGFPGELAESQARMCPQHERGAAAVIHRRLAQANASNPDGWAALTDALLRLECPHLPNGLATRLAGAEDGMYLIPEPDVLAERAALVVEATGWFAGRPAELAAALGQGPGVADLPDWMATLVLDLGRAGLGAQTVTVGDALDRVDPDGAATYAGAIAIALAQAGLPDQARARVASMLERWPDEFWCRGLYAGDALAALGDLDAAEAHFRIAREIAEDADDFEARSDAVERLLLLRRQRSGSESKSRQGQRRQPRSKPSRSQRTRAGRNRRRR